MTAAPLTILIKDKLRLANIPAELEEFLTETLTVVNPKWIDNQRMGRWNRGTPRVLKYFRRYKGGYIRIPRGYMGQLLRRCKKMGIDCEIDDRRRKLPACRFSFHGRLKPFQQSATDAMLAKDFGTLMAPTGSGKTVMALFLIAQRRQPALIVVHTKDLAFQWVARIEQFLGLSKSEIGFVGAGKCSVGGQVTVALVQSLYKRTALVAPKIGYVVVDECHRCPSRTFTEAVTRFDSRYMTGLSATPWRRDRLSKLIFWHLGDVHHEVDKRRLERSGDVLVAEVIVRETDFKPYFDPVMEYSKMLSELAADSDRNQLIAADVAAESARSTGVCLVLSDRKKHCETLHLLLRYKYNLPALLLTGDLTTAQRERVVEQLAKGQAKVIVATGQLIGEGFDSRELSTLFFATPVSFSGRVLQYLGRILRPAPGKNQARVFDYVDVHVPPLVKAAGARQRVYSSK